MPIRSRYLFIAAVLPIFLAAGAFAEGTRTWEQSRFDDLIKGTGTGIAIRSNGGLELAPAFKAISTTPATYIWAIASDSNGNLYAATGAPARIYRITPDGKSSVIFERQELQVQSLVIDRSGVIYAATNPDGKIYRLEHRPAADSAKSAAGKAAVPDASWSATEYFNPGTKYIWNLVLDNGGSLYAATGDHGEIFRVTPKGEGSVLFKSDETHIRVLALDPNGNLIAGSDGSGLIYRVSPSGEAFVLYSAPKKEITALAVNAAGDIYAAAAGEKRGGSAPSPLSAMIMPNPPAASASGQPTITITGITVAGAQPAGNPMPIPAAGAAGGSEVYRIAADGSPSRIWTSREDLVYALAFDQRGRLLAGTGNRGHIFSIIGDDVFTDLVKASATQVTAFAPAPAGGLYVSTSNLGKVFLLGPGVESEGSYESDVFDAHNFSRWGRAEMRGAGNIELMARSGNVDNPDRNWSGWKKIDMQKGAEVSVPPARFIQWKAVLRNGDVAPRLDNVMLNYLPKNVAPDFDDVTVQPGVRFPITPKPVDNGGSSGANQPHFDQPPPTTRDSSSIGVRWSVHDDNDDQMVYSVYYRGDGETRWLLLRDQLTDKYYSFDTSLLPDGGYTVKVVASDVPSHSPDQALSAERESSRFEVDTTAPQIEDLHASLQGGKVRVGFRGVDGFSPLKRAEYSLDAGDWQFVEPVGQLSDSKTETYDFLVNVPATPPAPASAGASAGDTEHVIVVRVYDRYDNMNSAKTVIRGK